MLGVESSPTSPRSALSWGLRPASARSSATVMSAAPSQSSYKSGALGWRKVNLANLAKLLGSLAQRLGDGLEDVVGDAVDVAPLQPRCGRWDGLVGGC